MDKVDLPSDYKEKLIEYLPKVGASFLIVIIFYVIAIIVNKRLLNYILINNSKNVKKKLIYDFLAKILYYAIITIGIFLGLANLGFNINTLLVIFGSAGLALALAIQSSVSQLVAGLIIIVFNYFNNDDLIEVNGTMGFVKNFNLLNTVIHDTRGVKIIIPNNIITGGSFTNYYEKEKIFAEFNVNISNNNLLNYDILLNNIKEALINNCVYVVDKENVFAIISNISSSGTEIKIKFLINHSDYHKAQASGKHIIRKFMSDNKVLLLDNGYLSLLNS
jgi:small conductance mechanosensitive channel